MHEHTDNSSISNGVGAGIVIVTKWWAGEYFAQLQGRAFGSAKHIHPIRL